MLERPSSCRPHTVVICHSCLVCALWSVGWEVPSARRVLLFCVHVPGGVDGPSVLARSPSLCRVPWHAWFLVGWDARVVPVALLRFTCGLTWESPSVGIMGARPRVSWGRRRLPTSHVNLGSPRSEGGSNSERSLHLQNRKGCAHVPIYIYICIVS